MSMLEFDRAYERSINGPNGGLDPLLGYDYRDNGGAHVSRKNQPGPWDKYFEDLEKDGSSLTVVAAPELGYRDQLAAEAVEVLGAEAAGGEVEIVAVSGELL